MNKFHFKTLDGDIVKEVDCIFPIMIKKGDSHEAIATGFYITINGIFITARHALGPEDKNFHPYIIHNINQHEILLRPIVKIIHKDNSDLAVGITAEMINNKNNDFLTNKIMCLTLDAPGKNEKIISYSYPSTEVIGKDPTSIILKPKYCTGNIVKDYPNGRDAIMLPSACWQTNMNILGGTSGGPVCNEQGFVFAINSTGINDSPISFVSSIKPILDINLGEVNTPGGTHHNCTIKKLIELKYIHLQ